MTRERDFDRLAREWLEQGPNEAPERVVRNVLQAVERTPQVRRLIRPRWRFLEMTRLPIVATLVVALVILVGGGLIVSRTFDQRGVGPGVPTPAASPVPATSASSSASPTPSLSPSSSPAAEAPVPDALARVWHGEPREVPGLVAQDRMGIVFNATTFSLQTGTFASGVALRSSASMPAPGQVKLVSLPTGRLCDAGQTGLYTWSTTPRGSRLTMTAIEDACAARSTALAGTWHRVGCKLADDDCLGELEAGTYPSQFITPRRIAAAPWAPAFGAITYTVPDGWANSADWPRTFSLTPSADYAAETASGPPSNTYHAITVYSQPVAHQQNDICINGIDTTVARTPAALVTWLTGVRGIQIGQPAPVTIGGVTGQMVDVRLAAGYTTSCAGLGTPVAVPFTEATGRDYEWGIAGTGRARLIFLDLGGGNLVMIAIETTFPTRFDQLVTAAMPIVQSFKFE